MTLRRMVARGSVLLAWTLLCADPGCAELKTASEDDDGADADSDADSDADTDTDTDTDTDADADTDSDSDTDTDSDADSDSDADTDSDADSDTDADGDGDSDSDSDTVACPYQCLSLTLCNLTGGSVEPFYWCSGDNVCCNPDPDTDTNPVECISGPCCDGGQFLGTDAACESWLEQDCESTGCGGDARQRTVERRCTGQSADCDGDLVNGDWALLADCASDQICFADGDAASCLSCPYGCVADQCEWVDWIPLTGGLFQMGSSAGGTDELPVHGVTVPSFSIGATEVTVLDFYRCWQQGYCVISPGTATGCNWNQPGRENHPVNCVDWNQAQAFCAWAGGRLPSEAEWEFAARSSGVTSTYPWGETPVATCDLVVMNQDGGGCGLTHTWDVCSKPGGSTGSGLCDMAGNVWEWTEDWYHSDYTSAPSDGSSWVVPAGTVRVTRGGGWSDHAWYMRATARSGALPSFSAPQLGFRCAR